MNGSILVVDDEDTLRITLAMRLSDAGFAIETATDGYEAIHKLSQKSFDLALLDLNMPGLNGMQVLEYMAATHPDVEAMILTGFSDMTTAIECLKKGARDYVVKPFDYQDLIIKIQTMFRARHSERSLRDQKQRWNSTLIFDVLGPMQTIDSVFSTVNIANVHQGRVPSSDLFEYTQAIRQRIFRNLEHAVSLGDIADAHVELKVSKFDLTKLIRACIDRVLPVVEQKQLRIEYAPTDESLVVAADEMRIEMCIHSLMGYAIQEAVAGSAATISTRRLEGVNRLAMAECRVVFTGKDQRFGEMISIIGDTYTAWREHKKETPFWLMNLAIGRRVFEAHGGSLSFEMNEGGHPTVTFTLPSVTE